MNHSSTSRRPSHRRAVGFVSAAVAVTAIAGLTSVVVPQPATATPTGASPAVAHRAASTAAKVAYLTFDDGPGPATRKVLKILTKHGATATFFQIGRQADADPKAAKLIKAQGSKVGNHTYDHPDLTRLTNAAIRREVKGGPAGRCVRPPYGAVNSRVRSVLKDMGKKTVLWTADTLDWSRPGVRAILKGAQLNLHDGSIILMHDGGGDRSQTLAALPKLLESLQHKGYRVAALPSC